MKTQRTATEIEKQAMQALGELLHQVSSVKAREIKIRPGGTHQMGGILANVDVLGRQHKLVCDVAEAEPAEIRKAVQKLRLRAEKDAGHSTPVLIAPYLSPQTRAICEESRIGFMDLQGNARLEIDEVFIAKRSLGTAPALHRNPHFPA